MTARDDLLSRAVAWFTENGIGDTSLRAIASGLGTSHRMLIYHFGSREGLLTAVVEHVEQRERDLLAQLVTAGDDPYDAGLRFWTQVADTASTFAPLYFELSGHAMQGRAHAGLLRDWLAEGWTDALTGLFVAAGHAPDRAADLVRMSLAMARGLLFDVAITDDRAAADRAMAEFVDLLPRPS
ncbi:MAG TPA: helix-turn-helix domain-containing protein [Nocardioides sp.]|nr:helix-turn-helix domain-containing protein [Nocardioides sp.]